MQPHVPPEIVITDPSDEGSEPPTASSSTVLSPSEYKPCVDDDDASTVYSSFNGSREDLHTTPSGGRFDASVQAISVRNGSTFLHSGPSCILSEESSEEPCATHQTHNAHHYLFPMVPSGIRRYGHGRKVKRDTKPILLRANEGFHDRKDMPKGWTREVHSEGLPFFHFKGNMLSDRWSYPGWEVQTVVTENWILDSRDSEDHTKLLEDLTEVVRDIGEIVRIQNLQIPEDCHLYLDLTYEDGDTMCGYYFANHERRILFWLKTCDMSYYMRSIDGDVSLTHIELYLRQEYWQHCEYFSPIVPSTLEILDLASDVIRDTRTDVLISRQSTSTRTLEELTAMSDILTGIRKQFDHLEKNKKCRPPSSYAIYTFLRKIYEDRVHDFHGEYNARLNRETSIYHSDRAPDYRSLLFKALSPFLFCAPNSHLREMNLIWADKITVLSRWKAYFTDLNNQWGEHIVHSSILLNANVAFLAIPMNDPNNNATYPELVSIRYAQQIASYLSVIASVTSMTLALLLVRQHKWRLQNTKQELHTWLETMDHGVRNLESLACLYSVPYAALIWGMITFFAAFLCMCFIRTTLSTRLITTFATVPFLSMVIWCLGIGWALYLKQIYKSIGATFECVWGNLKSLGRKKPGEDETSSIGSGTGVGSIHDSVKAESVEGVESEAPKRKKRWPLKYLGRAKPSPVLPVAHDIKSEGS